MVEPEDRAAGDDRVARQLLEPAPEGVPQELVARILRRVRAKLLMRDLVGLATDGAVRVFASFGRRPRGGDPPARGDGSHGRTRLG